MLWYKPTQITAIFGHLKLTGITYIRFKQYFHSKITIYHEVHDKKHRVGSKVYYAELIGFRDHHYIVYTHTHTHTHKIMNLSAVLRLCWKVSIYLFIFSVDIFNINPQNVNITLTTGKQLGGRFHQTYTSLNFHIGGSVAIQFCWTHWTTFDRMFWFQSICSWSAQA